MLTILDMDELTSRAHRLEQLRLTLGLAHAVPGAELLVRSAHGPDQRAGQSPDSDLHLCRLRHVVAAALGADRTDITRWIDGFEIQGSLRPDRAGTYTSVTNANGEWWFATLLRKDPVLHALQHLDDRTRIHDDIELTIKSDPCLGVTVVGIAAPHDDARVDAESIALRAYTACAVEEVVLLSQYGGTSS